MQLVHASLAASHKQDRQAGRQTYRQTERLLKHTSQVSTYTGLNVGLFPYLDVLSEERGGGEHLVALEARHTTLHVGVAQVFLERAADLEARAADGALPWHEVLVGVHMHQVVRLAGNDLPAGLALVLPIHLVLLQ